MSPGRIIDAVNGVVAGTTAGMMSGADVLPADLDSATWHRMHVLVGLAIGMAMPRDVAARVLDAMSGLHGGPSSRRQIDRLAGILTRAVRGDA